MFDDLRLNRQDASLALRAYAERAEKKPHWRDRFAQALFDAILLPAWRRFHDPAVGLQRFVGLSKAHESGFSSATDGQLAEQVGEVRKSLRGGRMAAEDVARCFALIREVSMRQIGQRHFDSQMMAGWALLKGNLVEMETGEGKTLAATLPACAVALAGIPVHVVTVNDYLAERDAKDMGPIYAFLGLSVGTVVQGMPAEARQRAYACDVTYCTNKELAFDYLRDRVALMRAGNRIHIALAKLRGADAATNRLVLRGLHFAIVDEADSIFIDEARTPLILASQSGDPEEQNRCQQALAMASQLAHTTDFAVDPRERSVTLTDSGKERIAVASVELGGSWSSKRGREELVIQALTALQLFHRDQHYIVTEGKVQIVDEFTGRVMADRSWEQGLHQMIEAKEHCELTGRRGTLARITYQRLFRRYLRLCGMTGTAREVAREVKAIYRIDAVKVPLHKRSQRRVLSGKLCSTTHEKWHAVVDAVKQAHGRPVLIGTRSVKASEELTRQLRQAGIDHALLNAKQDHDEAEIIAQAGRPGCVTVATNMAGRGTDIRLRNGVAELGGLHVILTEFHDARRIDRQLFGRCARQGDPGSCQFIVSLEDELFRSYLPSAICSWLARLPKGGTFSSWVMQEARRWIQRAAERRNAQVRSQSLELDRRLEKTLAFAGEPE